MKKFKICERCRASQAVSGECFCYDCRKIVREEIEPYLTKAPPFRGAWDSYRSQEQRERTDETKHGTGHG
jgi:hypothetical protein